MKPLPKFDKHAALTEAEEVKTWVCSDCGVPIADGTKCETCRQYWADVDDGLFADYPEPYYYSDELDEKFKPLELDRQYEQDDEDFNFHDHNQWEDY